MTNVIVVSVLSSLGLGLSLLLCVLLLRTHSAKNHLLSLLFLFLTLRVTKSVFYGMTVLPLYIKNLGLAANLAVGPLLYLYVRTALTKTSYGRSDFVHFLPTIAYALLSPWIPNGAEYPSWFWSYSLILIQSFVYVALSLRLLSAHRMGESPEISWLYLLTGCLSATWLMYLLIFADLAPLYALGPMTFSLLMFVMVYYFISHHRSFELAKKYVNARLSDDEGTSLLMRMREIMSSQKLFKDPAMSLSTMADILGISERNVSLIVNKHAEQNFTSFVHGYRIEEAKRLLRLPEQRKVLSVAYEVGFNNLATFNHSFKKETGMTPSGYRAFHQQPTNLMQDS
ncbi:MAG: helix-turn-helix domain-containing protein [Bacteroidota bacterium]